MSYFSNNRNSSMRNCIEKKPVSYGSLTGNGKYQPHMDSNLTTQKACMDFSVAAVYAYSNILNMDGIPREMERISLSDSDNDKILEHTYNDLLMDGFIDSGICTQISEWKISGFLFNGCFQDDYDHSYGGNEL